jgi:hypothetical protein
MSRLLVVLAPNLEAAVRTTKRLTGHAPTDLVLVDLADQRAVQDWLSMLRREYRTKPSERPSSRPSFLPRRK